MGQGCFVEEKVRGWQSHTRSKATQDATHQQQLEFRGHIQSNKSAIDTETGEKETPSSPHQR